MRSLHLAVWISAILVAAVFACADPVIGQAQDRSTKSESTRTSEPAVPFPLPGGEGGIGFDDLMFAPKLGRLLVPAGRTGSLFLIDPATLQVAAIGGFSAQEAFVKGHGEGTTSADAGPGTIFAIDRTALKLVVLDPGTRAVLASAALASSPDYVRWVEPTREIWVTQPGEDRLEIFGLTSSGASVPVHRDFISIPGGPESLVIDVRRNRAYTHLWKGTTLAIDLDSHQIVARWPNGCAGSRGIALDSAHGLLFAGCAEGRAVVLDVDHDGAVRDDLSAGDGVDIIAFNPELGHLYLPGGKSATMAILGVSDAGKLNLLATVKTAPGAHCVAVDDHRRAWVCDPGNGQLLLIDDRFGS